MSGKERRGENTRLPSNTQLTLKNRRHEAMHVNPRGTREESGGDNFGDWIGFNVRDLLQWHENGHVELARLHMNQDMEETLPMSCVSVAVFCKIKARFLKFQQRTIAICICFH